MTIRAALAAATSATRLICNALTDAEVAPLYPAQTLTALQERALRAKREDQWAETLQMSLRGNLTPDEIGILRQSQWSAWAAVDGLDYPEARL